jgi:hypothetical protein
MMLLISLNASSAFNSGGIIEGREKEYHGSPVLSYESPNEELGEGIILIEKGEYRCRTCNNLIALYRKFNK